MADYFSLSSGCTVPGRVCQLTTAGEVPADDTAMLLNGKPCVRQDLGDSHYRCGSAFMYVGSEDLPFLSYISGRQKGTLRFLSDGKEIATMQVQLPAGGKNDGSLLRQALLSQAAQVVAQVEDPEVRQSLQTILQQHTSGCYPHAAVPAEMRPWLQVLNPHAARQGMVLQELLAEGDDASGAKDLLIELCVGRWNTIWGTLTSNFLESPPDGADYATPVLRWWDNFFVQSTMDPDYAIAAEIAQHGGVAKSHRELRDTLFTALRKQNETFAVLGGEPEFFVPLLAEAGDAHYAIALALVETDPETQVHRLIDILDRLPAGKVACGGRAVRRGGASKLPPAAPKSGEFQWRQ